MYRSRCGAYVAIFVFLCGVSSAERTPVVLVHGIIAGNETMVHPMQVIQDAYPGVHVLAPEIGNGKVDSMFWGIDKMVDAVCKAIADDPQISSELHLVGYSQGGLVARGVLQKCASLPRVRSFVSWVSPQAGVFGVPQLCDTDCPHWLQHLLEGLYKTPYEKHFQHDASFAQYWKDPLDYSKYLAQSVYLADLNNERAQKNATYKERILSVDSLTLVQSSADKILVPRETGWWGFYKIGDPALSIVPLERTQQYTEDWLGLRTLDESKRLLKFMSPCEHQDYTSSCFDEAFGQVLPMLA